MRHSILEILTGFDGANPNSQGDVVMESARRFRLRPFNEPGSNDHYWFRLNTLVLNHGSNREDVELIVEWPVLERYPTYPYDYYIYGDMGNWHPVRATVKGAEARMVVPVDPGRTFVGFYPRYSYGWHQQFLASLPADSPYLQTQVEGVTAQGREITSLRLTDPSIPDDEKATLLITARNHPYETSGSYILEEMIRCLVDGCDTSDAILRRNVIYTVPMMNPDGVVLGCNQRTGMDGVNISFAADSDAPEVRAVQRLVERVRPSLWADVHSWPHQGDDGMWCTHQWIADGLLVQIPERSLQDYVWNVSFVKERDTDDNHLWKWLLRTLDTGGVSLSFSWYRRTEEQVRAIGPRLISALDGMMSDRVG